VLSTDIFFVNKQAFLLTMSRELRFLAVAHLVDRQADATLKKLNAATKLRRKRGFKIVSIHADPEFEQLREDTPIIETCGADDHIPDIERMMRTIKDRSRSAHRLLPFKCVPRTALAHLIKNAAFWLNAFPAASGALSEHSP